MSGLALAVLLVQVSPLLAAERTFQLSGQSVVLEDVSEQAPVYFRSMRLNRVLNVWNVEATVTNLGEAALNGPLVLLVESFTNTTGLLESDGTADGKSFLELSALLGDGALAQAEGSVARTLTLGRSGSGAPSLVARVFARRGTTGGALALTRSLDGAGQALPSVSVVEVGPQGVRTYSTDARFGLVTLGQGVGIHRWQFSHPNHLPAWRQATLIANDILRLSHPRLVRRGTNTVTLTAASGADLADGDGSVLIRMPPGFVASSTTATLTMLDGQTLPGLLPAGWSPVQAFWFELSGETFQPATAQLQPWTAINAAESATLVRWDTNTLGWIAQQNVVGAGAEAVSVPLNSAGAYALVLPDNGPSAPPAAAPGQALIGTSLLPPETSGLRASGVVEPPVNAASTVPELVTATATVTFSNVNGALPSGTVLHCEVREEYQMQDGSRRVPPRYDTFIVGYQRPGAGAGILTAQFPLRPLLLLGGDELLEARVTVDVLPPGAFAGSVMETNGGLVVSGGVQVLAAPGDFAQSEGALLRRLDPTNLAGVLVGTSNVIADAFQLDVVEVETTRPLVPRFGPQTTNSQFVLARVLSRAGLYGLEPIERFVSDATGTLQSTEPVSGDRLPGITGAGQYLLVRSPQPQALVTGSVRDSQSNALAGATVRLAPWVTYTDSNGTYRLLSPTGTANLAITDPDTGNTGEGSLNVTNAQNTFRADLTTAPTGPRVITVSPTNGAPVVARVTPIVVTFSEPVNPGTLLSGGLQLLGPSNLVSASLSLNLAGTIATLLPVDPLAANTSFTIQLSTNVADLTGNKLEGPNQFTFTTENDALNRSTSQLIIYEPGATNVPVEVIADIPAYIPGTNQNAIVVQGTPGTADPGVSVILANESTGETTTVLSNPDGSFASVIEGTEEDFVSATFVNLNGTRAYVPVSRQEFDNGFVGLYQQGGILEAEGDGGAVQVLLEPGAIESRSKFKVDFLSSNMIAQITGGVAPAHAKLLGKGANIRKEGGPVGQPLDVSFSIEASEVEIFEGMQGPEDGVFAMCAIAKVNGETTYLFLDGMRFDNGRLVSSSPPDIQVALNELAAAWEANAENMAMEAGAGFVVLATGQTIVEVGSHIPEPNASLMQFAVVAIQMQMSRKVRVTGKVIACDVNSTLPCDPRIRPGLPGAVVTIRGKLSLSAAPKGGLDRGAMFALTDSDGRYSILMDNPALIDFVGTIEDDEGLAIATATHTRFFGQRPAEPVFLVPTSPYAIADLAFVFDSQNGENGSPPFVSASHSPANPAPGEEVQLRILANHGASAPTIDDPEIEQVISLVPGVEVTAEDVEIDLETETQPGPRAVEKTYSVTTDAAVRVILAIKAGADNGRSRRILYAITFGGTDANVPDVLEQVDFNDQTGPTVVRTFPAEQTVSFRLGLPIQIFFNEPIQSDVEADPSAIQISPNDSAPTWALSPDQQVLTIQTFRLKPGVEYTVTVNPGIRDLAGNLFDQDPTTASSDSYSFSFTTAVTRNGDLPGLNSGGGIVLRGNYAYALDRGSGAQQNALVVFDLFDPTAPAEVVRLPFPGRPRDLALIPSYEFKPHPDLSTQTNDLLAVIGGDVNPFLDNDNNISFSGQFLRVYNLDNPVSPVVLASKQISISSIAAATKIIWRPPLLAYLESGPDNQHIGLVNLQSFIIGAHLTQAEFLELPVEPTPGNDINKDGDYVDLDEELPFPARLPFEFAGKVGSVTVDDTTQRIQDFDLNTRVGHLSVTLAQGNNININGAVTSTVLAPAYRILLDTGSFLPREDRAASSFEFPGGWPKRVFNVFGVRVVQTNQARLANLAFVSVHAGSESRLAVLDITLPLALKHLTDIRIAPEFGLAQSVTLADDGFLHLATSNHRFLIDPARLGTAAPDPLRHPAIVGMIPGAGSGNFTTDSSLAGLYAINLGEQSRIVQSSPFLRFGSLADYQTLLNPADIVDAPAEVMAMLAKFTAASSLFPARFRAAGDVTSTLSPPQPGAHYYVLVLAPGSAGETIDLALESLNDRGYPLRNKGLAFAPVRAMSSAAVADLGQAQRTTCDLPMRPLPAYRLSSDKGSPFYNYYLSRPFALTYEAMDKDELSGLQSEAPREILWSGHFLRATLDPAMAGNAVVGPFASVIDEGEKVTRPGALALAQTLPGDYIVGPNPPPTRGFMELPGTFGAVSAHNGEFRTETTDLTLPSRRFPIELIRHIGGQDLYDGPFGRGWDFNFNQRLVELKGGLFPPGAEYPLIIRGGSGDVIGETKDVLFSDGHGRTVMFFHTTNHPPAEFAQDPLADELGWLEDAESFYLPPEGVFDLLVRFPSGEFARLTPEGRQYWYDVQGRVTKAYDTYPTNELRLEYNTRGELVRIVDKSVTADRYLQFGYYRAAEDALFKPNLDETAASTYVIGKIARVRDYSGREIRYFYDDCGRMERKEGPEITVAGPDGFTGKPEIRYVYDDNATANGVRGVVAGSDTGAPLFVADLNVSEPSSPIVTAGTGAGGSVGVTLAHANTAAALAQGSAKSTVTLPDGHSSEIKLDERGLPSEVKVTGGGQSLARSYEFHTNGLLKKVTHPAGNNTEFFYQENAATLRSRGNLIRILHNPGPRGGGTLTLELPVADLRYNVPSGAGKDFNGNTVTLTLSTAGRDVEKSAFGSAGAYEYKFNEYGQVTSYTDVRGVETTYAYNSTDGFLTTLRRGALSYDYTYAGVAGSRGLATTIGPPQGADYNLTYNELGRIVRITRPGGYLEEFSYNRNAKLRRQLKSLGDGSPSLMEMEYAQNGFLESMTFVQVETGGFLEDLKFDYEPDALFRIKKITHPGGEQQTFENFTVLGVPLKMSFDDYAEEYTYDNNGNLTTSTGAGGGQNLFVYDGHDRLLSITSPTGEKFERTYFGDGSLKSVTVTDAIGKINDQIDYERDELGRAKKITRTGGQANRVEDWTYNGLIVTRSIVGGDSTTFTFDASGRASQVQDSIQAQTYAYDGLAVTEVASVEVDTHITKFTPINPFGFSQGLADDVGSIATYGLRHDGQITSLINARGDTTDLPKSRMGEALAFERPNGVELAFEYAPSRKLAKITDRANKGRSVTYNDDQLLETVTFRDGNSSSFTYENGAVKSVAIPGGSFTYRIDDQGRAKEATISFDGDIRQEAYTYDALNRVTSATFPLGSSDYTIDPLGPVTAVTTEILGGIFQISYALRSDGPVTQIGYPSGETVGTVRDAAGRLGTVTPSSLGAVIQSRAFAGSSIVGTETLGNALIQRINEYDKRKRPLRIAYKRASGNAVLAEVRYAYDAVNNQTTRQFVHRSGRADLFEYDSGYRLTKAHVGARPGSGFLQGPRVFSGFASGQFRPGFHARNYIFDGSGLDVLQTVSTQDPDNLGAPPFTASPGQPDSLSKDPLGNLRNPEVWIPDAGLPNLGSIKQLTLQYDGKGNLIRINRPDLVQVEFGYNEKGLAIYRKLGTAGLTQAERIYIYEGQRLIEEYNFGVSGTNLMARHFYADDDVPIASDLRIGGQFRRFYYLTDALGSVMALADSTGNVVERYYYDSFGQPAIEAADIQRPRIKRVIAGAGGSLLVEFSERVLPPLVYSDGTTLLQQMQSLAGSVVIEYDDNGQLRRDEGAQQYEEKPPESIPGLTFGAAVRFLPQFPIPPQQITLIVSSNRLADEWGNGNDPESITFAYQSAPGTVLYVNDLITNTEPVRLARSLVGSPFLFHGQYYDYDLGLYYLRARHFNPHTGLFLQRDPLGYEDGPNLYAAFGNNPINNRDPFGLSIMRTAANLASRAARSVGRSAKAIRGASAESLRGRVNALSTRGLSGDELKGIVGASGSRSMDDVMGLGRQAGLNITDEAVQIEAQFRLGGRDVDFVGQGGGWYIFRDVETGHGLRVRKGAQLSDADFEGSVRGHQVWDELGLMKFYGGHRRGEFPLANGQVLDREVFEIELFRGFRDRELAVDADGFNGSVYGARALTKNQQRRADHMNAYHRQIERMATKELDPNDNMASLVGGRFEILGEGVDQYGTDFLGRVRFPDPPTLDAAEFNAVLNAIRSYPRPF